MPISKKGRLYFTEEQYERARSSSALSYAQDSGYDLVRDSTIYYLREHDSMVFTQDGRWFWNSQRLAGRALEFIRYYEGLTLPEAVAVLNEKGEQSSDLGVSSSKAQEPQKPFELPPRAGSCKRLFAYLCGTRCLDPEIVRDLIHGKRLYESVRTFCDTQTRERRESHNAVFVGFDRQGLPRSGFQRGLSNLSSKPFKRDVAGSDKRYAFCIPGHSGAQVLAVFEASIDAISHATLNKLSNEDYRNIDRIALGGIIAHPLIQYLKDHPAITHVLLCLDNDPAGIQGDTQLAKILTQQHISFSVEKPKQGKDWNEYLVLLR